MRDATRTDTRARARTETAVWPRSTTRSDGRSERREGDASFLCRLRLMILISIVHGSVNASDARGLDPVEAGEPTWSSVREDETRRRARRRGDAPHARAHGPSDGRGHAARRACHVCRSCIFCVSAQINRILISIVRAAVSLSSVHRKHARASRRARPATRRGHERSGWGARKGRSAAASSTC